MKTNWQTKKLGEVCDIFNGNSINAKIKKEKYLGLKIGLSFIATKDVGFDNGIDYKNGVSIPINEKKFKISKKSSVLICAEGGSAGRKIGFTKEDVCFGNKLFSIHSNKLNNKFVYYFCFTDFFQKEFKKNLTGIIGGVSLKKFKNIEILLPSLPEQKRIVKILDEVFGDVKRAKENAEKNLANAKELFKSYLQSVFENPGKDWDEKKLGEVCDFYRGLTYKKNDEVDISRNIVLRANNIDLESNSLNFSELKYISDDVGIPENKKIKKNSVLICTASGSKKHLGKIAFIDKNYGYAFGGFMGQLVPNNKIIDSKYFYSVLTSNDFRKLLDSLMSGANINNLRFDLIKDFQIPLPPLPEQKRIVKILDELSAQTKKLEKNYQQKIDDLEELKKSVLKKAFEGEL